MLKLFRKVISALLVSFLGICVPLSAQAEVTLRDAIYLYNQDFYAGGHTEIYGVNCDVFQVVMDVESGYSDLRMWTKATSSSSWVSSTYPDRIYSSASMFAYMLYGTQYQKSFEFVDKNALSSSNTIGKGTVFGYCLSSNANAYVYLENLANCTYKFSNGTTSPISGCTPIGGGSTPSAPAGNLTDLYGIATFQYKFTGGTTTYTDSAQFSSASLDSSGTVLAALTRESSNRAFGCSMLNTTINGTASKYLCLVLDANGSYDNFYFNLNSSFQVSGSYEYCSSSTTYSQCATDALSPDGTVWGSVNRSGVTLAAKLSEEGENLAGSAKEAAKIDAVKKDISNQAQSQAVSTEVSATLNTLRDALLQMKQSSSPN